MLSSIFFGLLGREMLQTFLISSFFRVETLQCFRLRVCGNQFIPLDLLYAYIYMLLLLIHLILAGEVEELAKKQWEPSQMNYVPSMSL